MASVSKFLLLLSLNHNIKLPINLSCVNSEMHSMLMLRAPLVSISKRKLNEKIRILKLMIFVHNCSRKQNSNNQKITFFRCYLVNFRAQTAMDKMLSYSFLKHGGLRIPTHVERVRGSNNG